MLLSASCYVGETVSSKNFQLTLSRWREDIWRETMEHA